MSRAIGRAPRTAAGLAKPPTVIPTAGLTLTVTKADVEETHADMREALAAARALTVDSEESLVRADATLSEVSGAVAEVVRLRQEAVRPVKSLVTEVESWFRPFVKDLEATKDKLKATIGAYRLAKFEAAERERKALAAEIETTGRVDVQAIERVNAASEPDAARATTRYAWEVKRINPDLLPDEYWCPDREKLATIAAAAPGSGEPPVVPGVVFERVAIVGARK